MPFDRSGVWTQPTEEDHSALRERIVSKIGEIAPTPEMIAAIAKQLPQDDAPVVRNDVFNTVGKLKGGCDIILPVFDGLHVLVPCIESIIERTGWNYKLIIVDDCSPDPAVGEYLAELMADCNTEADITVITNRRNRGFPPTVNRGVAEGKNPYICILNSDTIVTDGWLVRQLMALEADDRNVIVNPATNNTALVNVPMYAGRSYLDMAGAVAVAPNTLTYNEIMPTGFCFTIRRSLWDDIGPFDEAYVRGYGEETHFWAAALKMVDKNGILKRYRGIIADNAYIFHERGTSFSQLDKHEHMGLRRGGSERFNKLNPDFKSWQQGFNAEGSVRHLRDGIPEVAFAKKYKGNVAWVVKSAGACGGMLFIADIVNRLIEDGYNAVVCVIPDDYDEVNPPNLQVVGNLRTSPILFKSHTEFTSTFAARVFTKGKVFAAVTELAGIVWDLDKAYKGIEGFNHVQSYDVELAEICGKPEMVEDFSESYRRLPNVVSSKWVAEKIRKLGGDVREVILPGVNPNLFHGRDRARGDERFTIAVLVNDQYVFKGAEWAIKFLEAMEPAKRPELRVLAIGPDYLPTIQGVHCLGNLPAARLADLLGTDIDVLVDSAQVHSYGLPALEALYSGCSVITRRNKGINEYEEVWNNCVAVEDDPKQAAEIALSWSKDSQDVGSSVWSDATDRETNVRKFVNFLYPKVDKVRTRIEVVTPHLRKHGGPTTIISIAKQLQIIGHDTSMAAIYTDFNPEVLNQAQGIDIRTAWQELPEDIEVVIINSDNPFAEKLMENHPDKKFIMLKLSHNPRFKATENDNLNLPWAHIMTSTAWLRGACLDPSQGWTHQAWDPEKVTTIGWYHYGHEVFNMPPTNRTYGNAQVGFRMGTLIHDHPLKGTLEAMGVIDALKRKYEANIQVSGFGEVRSRMPEHMQYIKSAGRKDMAHVFKQLDVWFGASKSEGLGRLALEAMSAGVAVVTTDTGAEHMVSGENCLLYPVGDMQAGGEAVDLLVNDEELFKKIIIAGHATAEKNADPEPIRQKLKKVIKEVAS